MPSPRAAHGRSPERDIAGDQPTFSLHMPYPCISGRSVNQKVGRPQACGDDLLSFALQAWNDDPTVFLPEPEITRRPRALQVP